MLSGAISAAMGPPIGRSILSVRTTTLKALNRTMADEVFPCGHPMSSENTYTAGADREPRCRTCLPGNMREYKLERRLWEKTGQELTREVRDAYTNTGLTVEVLAEMYGVTELRIRKILGLEGGPYL
jgi:hypothetical protein